MSDDELTALWARYGQMVAANAAHDVAGEEALVHQLVQAVPVLLTEVRRGQTNNLVLQAQNTDLQRRLDGLSKILMPVLTAANATEGGTIGVVRSRTP